MPTIDRVSRTSESSVPKEKESPTQSIAGSMTKDSNRRRWRMRFATVASQLRDDTGLLHDWSILRRFR
jgi:hypothetical protein